MGFFVYQICNLNNDKRYVGSTTQLRRRHQQHLWGLRNKRHHSPKLQNAWEKHGENAFQFCTIAEVENHDMMVELEQFVIDESQSVQDGYNINPIANSIGALPKTEEHKRKIGLGRLGKRNTEEAKRRMSLAAIKRGPIQRSRESYERGATKIRGRKMSDEARAKLREAFKNRKPRPPMTAETKLAIAKSKVGRKLIDGKFVRVQ